MLLKEAEVRCMGTLITDPLIVAAVPAGTGTHYLGYWITQALKDRYPMAMDWESEPQPWCTAREAISMLRDMASQRGMYEQHFVDPEAERLISERCSRLIRMGPAHLRGILLAMLGPTRGKTVAEVVL